MAITSDSNTPLDAVDAILKQDTSAIEDAQPVRVGDGVAYSGFDLANVMACPKVQIFALADDIVTINGVVFQVLKGTTKRYPSCVAEVLQHKAEGEIQFDRRVRFLIQQSERPLSEVASYVA